MARALQRMACMQAPRIVIPAGDTSPSGALDCAQLISPLDHVSVLVSPEALTNTQSELEFFDGVQLSVQLRGGRDCDLLLALARAFSSDPLSSIVFLPPLCCVTDPYAMSGRIIDALRVPEAISVIGWSSDVFIAISSITALWDLLRSRRPGHAALLECYVEALGTEDEGRMMLAVYDHVEEVDFAGMLATAPTFRPLLFQGRASPPPLPYPRPRKRTVTIPPRQKAA